MKAMLLAAGRGERMRPLTDHTAKPLLAAGGRALIDYHLFALQRAGVQSVVVNLSWQASKLRAHLGDGERFGFELHFSEEGPVPLETGGGIYRALPWLGPGAFLVVNADVWTDFPLRSLALPAGSLAHLVLVPNPAHHPGGDFALGGDGRIGDAGTRLTYSGIGVFDPEFFAGCQAGRFPLKPLLDRAREAGRLSGESWTGRWFDVGTPARLAALDLALRAGELVHPAVPAATRETGQPG
jgi:N-acetyl-alpha-D-muramate 1-phosphate uridylyltransferase